MAFCELKLSKECDLITIKGVENDEESLENVYALFERAGFKPWSVCRCEVFRSSSDITFLIPTGRLCELLSMLKELKKTTPHLMSLIRTGVVKIDINCSNGIEFLNALLRCQEFPKPEFVCASENKTELIFESYDAPAAIGIISQAAE